MFVRLLESKNELVAEGASEAMLHIVTPSQQQEGAPAQTASHAALRAAGAIPTLLSLVRHVSSAPGPKSPHTLHCYAATSLLYGYYPILLLCHWLHKIVALIGTSHSLLWQSCLM